MSTRPRVSRETGAECGICCVYMKGEPPGAPSLSRPSKEASWKDSPFTGNESTTAPFGLIWHFSILRPQRPGNEQAVARRRASRSRRSDPVSTGSVEPSAATSDREPGVEAQLGPSLAKLRSYAGLLGTDGVVRGLIGPRETPRLWDRHILNSAALLPLLPHKGVVVDVGSGAGLPGMVLGIIRPGLAVILLEPLLRRVGFLTHCVEALDLPNVTVLHGRAEQHAGLGADVAVARAVAPLPRLAKICLPLLRPEGELLALKGERAADELQLAQATLRDLGASSWSVVTVAPPDAVANATVIRVVAGSSSEERDQPRRRQRGQEQREMGSGGGPSDTGRAHGGG